jgi:hypothetical protein
MRMSAGSAVGERLLASSQPPVRRANRPYRPQPPVPCTFVEEEHYGVGHGLDQGDASGDHHRSRQQVRHAEPHDQVKREEADGLGEILAHRVYLLRFNRK